jgi:GR25 family glycosyltransferase involved in LPS biosynthesis
MLFVSKAIKKHKNSKTLEMENKNFDIYVINLDKDADRLKKITKHLEHTSFKRISGINGEHEDFVNHPDIFYTSRYLVPKSTLGCTLSHRSAMKTFIEESDKPYVVILEDDAEPTSQTYMNKIEDSIKNAPSHWDMIKLDYAPAINFGSYNKIPTLLTTAYIINKNGAEKLLTHKLYYHFDIELAFFGLNIYNNPEIVFQQVWDENNNSNNRLCKTYNPFCYIDESLNFKALRLGTYEFTYAEIALFLLCFILLYIHIDSIGKYFDIVRSFSSISSTSNTG